MTHSALRSFRPHLRAKGFHRKIEWKLEYSAVMVQCDFCNVYGDHFSDACSLFQGGAERYDIIRHESRLKGEQCWYYFRVVHLVLWSSHRRQWSSSISARCSIYWKKKHALKRLAPLKKLWEDCAEKASSSRRHPDTWWMTARVYYYCQLLIIIYWFL